MDINKVNLDNERETIKETEWSAITEPTNKRFLNLNRWITNDKRFSNKRIPKGIQINDEKKTEDLYLRNK